MGAEESLADTIVGATQDIISELTGIGCLVSVGGTWAPGGKTVAVGSTPVVVKRMTMRFKAMGVKVHKHVRHLGVDYAPGRKGRRSRPIAAQRLKDAKTRGARVKKLGLTKRAAGRVLRTAILPAAVHGAAVTGVTNKQLKELMSLAHSSLGKSSGLSAYARLSLGGGIPGEKDAVAPIFKWARAAFDQTAPRITMQRAWKRAVREVGLDPDPQGAAKGPAGATVSAAARLGWKMVGPFVFQEPTGNQLDVRYEAPHTVRTAALEWFDRWTASKSSLADQIEGGIPYLEPLRDVIRKKATPPAAKASLKVMAEGGWPTQASLYAAGMAEDPLCRACGEEPGTLYHRVRSCCATSWMRQGPLGEESGLSSGQADPWEETSTPLWSRGIGRAPQLTPPPPFHETLVLGKEELGEDEMVYQGVAAADGSMIDVRPTSARRAGWGAVSADLKGELRFLWYGTCPDRCPTAHRAELWGVIGVLRRARFPLTLLTDCEAAVKAWARGRVYCCDGSRKAADLWRSIWDLIDERSQEHEGAFRMVWVKGHTSIGDVLQGRISALKHAMNVLADTCAGQGAEAARALVPNAPQVEAYGRAVAFHTLLAKLCSNWSTDYRQERESSLPRRVRQMPTCGWCTPSTRMKCGRRR